MSAWRKFLHPVDAFCFIDRVPTPRGSTLFRLRGIGACLGGIGMAALGGSFASGCGTSELPPTCAPGQCAPSATCVQGRCRSNDANVATTASTRLLLEASDVGVVASRNFDHRGPVDAVALGREANGDWVMLLSFSWTPPESAIVDSAFVILSTIDDATPASQPIPIELAPVLSTWTSADLSWGRLPQLGVARAALPLTVSVEHVRTEVTDIVRGWNAGEGTQSVAILAEGVDPVGATFSTGLSRGPGPRLEVYLR